MPGFKDIRKRGRSTLKKHYVLLVIICMLAVFLGTEFSRIPDQAQNWYDILQGKKPSMPGIFNSGAEDELFDKVIGDLVSGKIVEGKEEAAERTASLQESPEENPALGRREGVLAAFFNFVNSGELYASIGLLLYNLFHSGRVAAVLLMLLGAIFFLAVWIFIRNVYCAIMRRAFLEARLYTEIPLNHLLYIKLVGRWVRTSLTLAYVSLLQMLWNLTIVGGVIKHYSYFLVPFIAAENPDIKAREAVSLSRRIMDGHKMECFKLNMTFIGWHILGYVTFGVVSVLWTVPYLMAAYAEYYALLREQAKAAGIEGAELLNDECLFTPPEREALELVYADVFAREGLIDIDIVELSPRRNFIAKNFGIWLASIPEKRVFSHQESLRHQMRNARVEAQGGAYPQRMSSLWTKSSSFNGVVNYLSPCTIWTLVVIFFIFCIFGWVWEVSLHLITNGVFVNRGTLHGPWLPIYGGGVVLIAVLLYRLRRKPVLEAVLITVVCGLVEYLSSLFLELSTGMHWWDYTGYFLNLDGRICAEGLAVFCIGGMAAVYLLIPLIDAMVLKVRPKLLVAVCSALLLLFGVDFIYSQFVPNVGEGITSGGQAAAEAGSKT